MRFARALLALVVGLGAGMPAGAAQNLACATGLIDPALTQAVFKAYRSEQDFSQVIIDRTGKQLVTCVTTNSWSKDALESVIRIMVGQMLLDGLAVDLAPSGISIDALTRSIDIFLSTLPRARLRRFVDGDVTDEEGQALAHHFVVNEIVSAAKLDEKLGSLLGEFAAARGNLTYFTEEFAAQ